MLTILLLACKSDQGLQDNNQNPGRSLDQEACECPDNSADVTALQEELNSLRDRVITLETAPEPEPVPEVSPSSLVVTEYDVDCLNQTVRFDYYFDGEAYPLNYLTSGDFGVYNRTAGCVWAKIDPFDPPMIMTNSYFYDMRLDSQGWPNGSDLMANNGNNWFFSTSQGVGNSRVNEDGFVYGGAISSGAPWQRDCSSYTDPDGDCPWTSPLVRVVIIDDKPALRPEAW